MKKAELIKFLGTWKSRDLCICLITDRGIQLRMLPGKKISYLYICTNAGQRPQVEGGNGCKAAQADDGCLQTRAKYA
jgi:hypothetical protein